MKQYGVLAAAFGGTLAVLLIAFLVIEQMGAAGASSQTTPVAEATPIIRSLPPRVTPSPGAITPRPSGSFRPRPSLPPDTLSPSPPPSPTPRPSGTPRPTPTPKVTPSPVPPGTVVQIVVPGAQFLYKEVPSNGTVTKLPTGSVVIETTREYSEALTLMYKLPVDQLPSGAKVASIDTAICGYATGDFWESYGPAGSDPMEDEVTAPGPDGCWHYVGGGLADTRTLAIITGATRFQISKVVYTITTAK